jgi:hypothetical protein
VQVSHRLSADRTDDFGLWGSVVHHLER